uniref:Uncharacterized protein n=1 Tax=Stomoxys calcitrans TaxID=35570 RepID=A0A1I8P5H5_STOCA
MNMVNSELMFERNVTQWTVDFNFDFLVKGKRQVNLFHTQLNACQLLKDSTRNKFLALFMKEVKRTSNYPSTCPFAKDTLYALRNYTIDPEDYPATFPAWQWRFDLNSVFNKIYALNVTVKGRIRKT